MARLRVEFAQIEHGWVQCRFWVEEEEHEIWFSYLYRDSFAQLGLALLAQLNEEGERVVAWMEEPGEYEMRFRKRADDFSLELWRFESFLRETGAKSFLEFTLSGSYTEMCVPFWRALKALRSLYSDQEFETHWRGPFPNAEFDELTRELKARGLT